MTANDLGGEAGKPTGPSAENGGPAIVDGSTDCARRPPAFDVGAARARCKAAVHAGVEGWEPWHAQEDGAWRVGVWHGGRWYALATVTASWNDLVTRESIATFIAHARTDLPTALDEIDRLSKLADVIKEEYNASEHHWRLQWQAAMLREANLKDERDRLQELVADGQAAYDEIARELANAREALALCEERRADGIAP